MLKFIKDLSKATKAYKSTIGASLQNVKRYYPKIYLVFLFLIFAIFLFFRFYKLSTWANLGWDQVNNAWAAVRIIDEHNYPLRFMVKGSSGLYIGPLYYYLVAGFYYLTNYDPIASPLLAGFSAIFSFAALYICVRKLHGAAASLIAVFIYTFSIVSIAADRVQWQPNFIPPVSLMLLFCLYNVIRGKPKYLLWVGLILGLSYHLHFTVFLFIGMTVMALTLFPRKRQTFLYGMGAAGIFAVFLLPTIIYGLNNTQEETLRGTAGYTMTYYHGFHLRRFMQLTRDAIIDVQKILPFKFIGIGKYFLPFLYWAVMWFSLERKKTLVLSYLVLVWLLVPWLAFTTYSGEISDYYFSSFRFIVIMMCSYILTRALRSLWLIRILALFFLGYYAVTTLTKFYVPQGNMMPTKQYVKQKIDAGSEIPFVEGKLDSYLYHIYTKVVPDK